jgi:hypothetical protein
LLFCAAVQALLKLAILVVELEHTSLLQQQAARQAAAQAAGYGKRMNAAGSIRARRK